MIARAEDAAPRPVACTHCSLPVPRGLVAAGRSEQFCCAGCRAVWESLHACGLAGYYALRDAEGAASPQPGAERSLAHLDGEEFLATRTQQVGPDRRAIEMRLDGLRCGACVWLLERLPRLEPGLASLRVDLGRQVVRIEWAPSATRLSAIAARLARFGYAVAPLGDPSRREEERRLDRGWLVRMGVAAAISANAMAIAFALYGGMFAAMDPAMKGFLHSTSVLLAAIAVLGPGRLFLANAWAAIRTRTPHMDLPISAALLAGLLGGAVATIRGEGGVYAESVTMLVFLLLAGRFLQFRQQRRARHEIELLCSLVPSTARRVGGGGGIEEVATEALRVGDLVEVPAGETLPADGSLLERHAWLDLAVLTGESRPVRVGFGERVYAGSRATESSIRIEVAARGGDTRAAAIARLVEQAASQRAPVVAFADRIGGWFLAAVLLLSAATAAIWWHAGPAIAIERAVALLIVTCPCALGLATPLAMVASLGKAARRGILVRGGERLERLAKPGTIVLDKTGTLTLGRVEVLRVIGDRSAVEAAAHLEAGSVHPVAKAIASLASAGGAGVRDRREIAGRGIEGIVGGRAVAVGSQAFLDGQGIDTHGLAGDAASLVAEGVSPVWVAIDGRAEALLGVGDPLRPESGALVAELQRRGWQVRLLSGDLPQIAAAVGASVGLEAAACVGGASPEEKAAFMSRADLARPVVMVGDGVNDLAAIAAADVGVAVRDGAAAAFASADVCLSAEGLAPLVSLLDGARRTLWTVKLNFLISTSYNVLGATLAMTGAINPLIAAIIMPVAGLTGTAFALRMPRFRDPAAAIGGVGPDRPMPRRERMAAPAREAVA